MHICLIAPNDGINDPRARVTRHLLEVAGHTVVMVTAGEADHRAVSVAPRSGLVSKIKNRLSGQGEQAELLHQRLVDAGVKTGATMFVPTDARALAAAMEAARTTGGVVSRTPKMDRAHEVDLIDLAPRDPALAEPPSGLGRHHTPSDERAPRYPKPGRHQGKKVILCYRRSEINPGRYLEAALRDAGASLRVETEGIDLGSVDVDTDVVIFVEGPYPALKVDGDTPVPVLFWAHHGEHHLHANIRLTDRYRADAVLLAHSWHLAYWFPAPVHRFPFGMASGLLNPSLPLTDRSFDVAIVGAGIRRGGQYGRRQHLVAALEEALPVERLAFRENVSAEEMSDLYSNSRIVINEGGTRHYPITMRVLEAVGSGAVLLTDPLPGMEMILDPVTDHAQLGDDVVADVSAILSDLSSAQAKVDSALARANGSHTYAHRVDDLFSIANTTRKRTIPQRPKLSLLADVIDHDVQTQRIAHLNAPELVSELPSREVWDANRLTPPRLSPGKMETVAMKAKTIDGHEELLQAARRFIYVEGGADLSTYLGDNRPGATVTVTRGVQRVDTRAPSYRIMDFEKTK